MKLMVEPVTVKEVPYGCGTPPTTTIMLDGGVGAYGKADNLRVKEDKVPLN